MPGVRTRVRPALNAIGVLLYRQSGGRVGGSGQGGVPVLLLTVAGRRSGMPHTVAVRYVLHKGAYYVAATGGGRPEEPQWIRNLRVAAHATIEVGTHKVPVDVSVLRGADRDAAWQDLFLKPYPYFADYATKSGRTIAVARLTPAVLTR